MKLTNKLQRKAAKMLAGFFALILFFTFVSRISDGFTIAKVTVDTIKSGDITNRTTISGTMKPVEDRDVILPENVSVTSVKVDVGERVKTGDVLLEFDEENVKEQLLKLKDELSVLDLKLEVSRNGSANGDTSAVSNAKRELEQAEADYESLRKRLPGVNKRFVDDLKTAKADLTDAKKTYNEAVKKAKEERIATAKSQVGAAAEALEATKESADEAISNAKFAYDSAYTVDPGSLECSRAKETLQGTQDKWAKKISAAEQALSEAEKDVKKTVSTKDVSGDAQVIAAKGLVDAANKAVLATKRAKEDNSFSSDEQMLAAKRKVETARENLEKASKDLEERNRTESNARNQNEMDEINALLEKSQIKRSISLLEEIVGTDGKYLSPVDGTIRSIGQAGKTVDRVPIAVIDCDGQGFTFEGKVESKMAEELAAGDVGELTYESEGKQREVDAVITSIGAVDEEDNVLVTATLPEGSYLSGTLAEMTVEKKSERQTALLPIGALRSDSEDEFVFVIQEKKTVMGSEWFVVRVPVEALDSDNEMVSIESTLTKEDKVVTSSNKVIAEGDRVRLEEE